MSSVNAKSAGVAFLAGALFATGLVVSGMTQPSKVVGFLDVAGAWDPSLAFVMIGAIAVHFTTRRLIVRRRTPILAASFDEPKPTPIDTTLLGGSAIFGVGWALSGYCPGPSIVTLGAGSLGSIVFVFAMGTGMWLHRTVRPRASALVANGSPAIRSEPLSRRMQADG